MVVFEKPHRYRIIQPTTKLQFEITGSTEAAFGYILSDLHKVEVAKKGPKLYFYFLKM